MGVSKDDLEAFVWSVRSGLRRLGNLGEGPTTPMDVNSAGTVVGASHGPRGRIHAFRWTVENGMEDLTARTTCETPRMTRFSSGVNCLKKNPRGSTR